METATCPLCGNSVELTGVLVGKDVLCPGCRCTFTAPLVRKKRPVKKNRVKKSSKTRRRPQSRLAKFAAENQKSLLSFGKIAGIGAVGLIVVIAAFQGLGTAGEQFSKESQIMALKRDLKSAMKSRKSENNPHRKKGNGPLIILTSFKMKWDKEENDCVPFTVKAEGFVDGLNHVNFLGKLYRKTGNWSASSELELINYGTRSRRIEFDGIISSSESSGRTGVYTIIIVVVVLGTAVGVKMKFM